MTPTKRKGNKRTKSGPKVKYETGPFVYGSRAWYASDIGGKKSVKKEEGAG